MEESDRLKNYDTWALAILIAGIILTIVGPIIFTRPLGWLDLSNTGEIGSSIGGMTAPFIGLTSAGLIYLSFRAQIKMNIRQWEEIKKQNKKSEITEQRNYATTLFDLMILNYENAFNYSNKAVGQLKNLDVEELNKTLKILLKHTVPLIEISRLYEEKLIDKEFITINFMKIVANTPFLRFKKSFFHVKRMIDTLEDQIKIPTDIFEKVSMVYSIIIIMETIANE
jgi:hypothetical protein